MIYFPKLSHVKVFTLAVVILTTTAPAQADDYLMEFVVSGQSKGEFLVSRNGDEATAEAAFWKAAGVNATEALPLARINGLGTSKIIWSEQKIYFYPLQAKTTREIIEPEIRIEPIVNEYDIKSADYYLTYHSKSDESLMGSVTASGRMVSFDLDFRAGIGNRENYFSGQWHDEDNKHVKDLELGRVQRYGLDGISLTNESYLAVGQFSTDRIELYWPVGTRVDIYRDGTYIESAVLDSDPYPYEIELDYANNRYEFNAVLPDGRTDKRTVERSVSGRLAPVGKLNYRMAAGQIPDGDSLVTGYISYGLSNDISIFGGRDYQERNYFSTLYARNNSSLEASWYGSSGWALNGNWQNDYISLLGRISDLDDYKQQSLNLSFRGAFHPSIQHTSRSNAKYESTETTFRTYHSAYMRPLRSSLSLSPYFAVKKRNNQSYDAYGVRALANMPYGWQATVTYEKEQYNSGFVDIKRFQGEVSKRFRLGQLTYRHIANDFGNGWSIQQQSIRANLWNWDAATLSAGLTRSADGDRSFSVSISGSLGRSGLTRIPQRNQAMLEVSTCLDTNTDGLCQADEPEIEGVSVKVGGLEISTPAAVGSLTPYRRYNIEISGNFGLSPRYSAVESGRLVRGGVNRIRLPISEIREVEGQLEKDGIRVALVDKKTGDVLSEQTTEFGGWYLFYAPSHKDVEVVRVYKPKLSHVKENEPEETHDS